jgi:U4/U6 small nuclear ribonucleoprotein PRP3
MAKLAGSGKKDEPQARLPTFRFDELGREVDEEGNIIQSKRIIPATALINKNQQREKVLKPEKPPSQLMDPRRNPFFDPALPLGRRRDKAKAFRFIEPGKYIKLAQRLRGEGDEEAQTAAAAAAAAKPEGMEVDGTHGGALGTSQGGVAVVQREVAKELEKKLLKREAVPDVEWWDQPILVPERVGEPEPGRPAPLFPSTTYSTGLNLEKVTHYVEHPVPIQPPHEKAPEPIPLMLTKAERKKLRKRTRREVQKEKQDRILLGLEEPPPPKVKISNLYRVLGAQAVADPTALENTVRAQMAARLTAHHNRNQERKLTPEQRKEKKLKKITEDTSKQIQVGLYRIGDLLRHPKCKFKVDINAQQYHLTGCVITCGDITLLIVEGGPRAMKHYKRLLLHRIDWNSEMSEPKQPDPAPAAPGAPAAPAPPPPPASANPIAQTNNLCEQIWEGVAGRPSFKNFRFEHFEADAGARKFLQDRGVGHYWDLARNYVFGTNPVAAVSESKKAAGSDESE